MKFNLKSDFSPTGDQPEAIADLVQGINDGIAAQTLLGVTGSGKTFTVANVIEKVERPTLILSHNKTLAAQLYQEFKTFFPDNAVEYFVSYYDYYQPEAYLPSSDTYIEKDLSINDDIEKLRLSTTTSLLSGRKDVIVVSSVSCIYGIGNPVNFSNSIVTIEVGQKIARNLFLRQLVDNLYSRTTKDLKRGNFRVVGDTIDIHLAYADFGIRITFWGDEIDSIGILDLVNNKILENQDQYIIYPANIFVTDKEDVKRSIFQIQDDLVKQIEFFNEIGKNLESKRIQNRVELDLEMIRELGYCSGIENYSRYFDNRKPGDRPFCLLDYFPEDFLMVIDESHVTVSQIKAMYGGDRSRKVNLVDYGFRLPAALDNRPLKFEEFEQIHNQIIYVSATPAEYELTKCDGIVTEQLIRPTGLLDPEITVKPKLNQVDDLLEEIRKVVEEENRVLVTTLTKRMAEELDKYFAKIGIRSRYIHSDVDTLERVEILQDLRKGIFDVLIGVNLLREGLDLPEVSLVAILDADNEGFLRSERSLVQTVGRAARNINGRVIMYADKITKAMEITISETNRRREKQRNYNRLNGIVPTQIIKSNENDLLIGRNSEKEEINELVISSDPSIQDPVVENMGRAELEKSIDNIKKQMEREAKKENFMQAAVLRDELFKFKKILLKKFDD
ncbi:MAG: excinuclease ABC subunit UvrB [Flavobacteriales bacterium]|nr:excinuclease ABC subunit UvrB [Flavobacteriales bacterium]MBL6869399.1 excinuclease ABC subunit UvrB [Flavobacteriales bacterium]